MNIETLFDRRNLRGVSGLFLAHGSFGMVDGECDYTCTTTETATAYRYDNGTVALTATFIKEENGVVIRHDRLENLTDEAIEINGLCSRFFMEGSKYEVYTQYNAWQHESSGAWQPLVTQVKAIGNGIRTCEGAAPVMAFHNRYNGRNTVFHLMPNAQWQLTAKKIPLSDKELVVLEAGFHNENMKLIAAPHETIELPEVWFFEAKNRTDLDAYKLHEVYNRRHPRARQPVLYNSWLYCFDRLNIDDLKRQADAAADLGVEAFMVDAGWFGKGESWFASAGDWEENTVGGPQGRLLELADHIRDRGMIFGLWFEPERAAPQSWAVQTHPDYYIDGRLLNFGNPEAVEYMVQVLSEQIVKYHIGWLKFDFNANIPLDPSGQVFYRYLQGQRRFVERLRRRFPDLYITNCASGGYRMEGAQGTMFDSFWLSDNQGPYEGIRIVKDTLKRLPSSLIERWSVQQYADGFPYYKPETGSGILFNCNNATWDFVINVQDSFTKGFVSGGPIGLSCDVAAFPLKYREWWKQHIAEVKRDRDFHATATARVLVDEPDIIALQYADSALDRCVVQLFTKVTYADQLTVYPVVSREATYRCPQDETVYRGDELLNNGLRFDNLKNNGCRIVELVKEK